MENSLTTVIKELESLYSKLNKEFFNDELQKAVVACSPDHTKSCYGWCTTWKAWKDTSDESTGFYEINICAEHMSRSFEEIVGTLLHEMVHLWNIQNGVKDCSRGNSYHNKAYKESAEKRGLIVTKDEKYGYCKTTLNDFGLDFVEREKSDCFKLVRTKMADTEKTEKKKSSSKKYICPDCGAIVRATKEVRIICADCDVEFELEEV